MGKGRPFGWDDVKMIGFLFILIPAFGIWFITKSIADLMEKIIGLGE